MSADFDAVGVGSCAIDYIGLADGYPSPDTKNQLKGIQTDGGGPVGTAIVALARLGARVSYLGKLGTTPLAQTALQGFKSEGVDVSRVITTDKSAGPCFAFVLTDTVSKQRTIWYTDQEVAPLRPEEVPKDAVISARYLLVDEYEIGAATACAGWAKEAGTTVVLDAENPRKDGIGALLDLTDILIVPEAFALGYTGTSNCESAARALKRKDNIVAVTMGRNGSYSLFGEGGQHHQPIFDVDTVDTTGCGDVFHGAFVYGLLQGWPVPIIAEFSTAVSSIKSRKPGGRSGIPGFAEVAQFLAERGSAGIKNVLVNGNREGV